jgi:spore germination protein YaaH
VGCVLAAVLGAGARGAAGAARSHRPPARATRTGTVTAWLPYWEMPAALDSTLGNSDVIGIASPYWYEVIGDSKVHEEAGAGSRAVVAELLARHVQVVPMVTEQAGMAAFERTIAGTKTRAALVRTLVKLATHPGYAGLDLDFESFVIDPRHRRALADRVAALYPVLVGQVCSALRAIGRSCDVTVMARTTASHVNARFDTPTWVYDYGALARVADRVQIMAYDDHSPGGPAGPIAPLPWVRRVIAFARTQGDPSRFELGLPAYGYEWYGRTTATAVFARQGEALAASMHARLRWDPAAAEETFSFRRHHRRETVWFDDARADALRAGLAAQAGFSGVAVWAAGYEQSSLWQQLRAAAG